MTNIGPLLEWGVRRLSGSSTPRLDVEVLLACALGCERVELYTVARPALSAIARWRYWQLIRRRQAGVPVAYLTGQKEFFGLNFIVNRRVLIPRPETETVVRRTLELINQHQLTSVHDIGTGSGNIAVALAKQLPALHIVASDVSKAALAVARRNAVRHRVKDRIEFVRANLGEHIASADLVVANLPYVPDSYHPTREIFHEPRIAVFGPDDGLELYRRFCLNTRFRFAVIELGSWQMDRLVPWLNANFPAWRVETIRDDSAYICGLTITTGSTAGGSVAPPPPPPSAASHRS